LQIKLCTGILAQTIYKYTEMPRATAIPPPPSLDPPAYAMTASRYVRDTIAISVYPQMRAGRMSLMCADEQAHAALAVLVDRARRMAPVSADAQAYASAKVDALFANNFNDDVWYSQAPGLPPVLFIKKTAIDGVMNLDEAVRCTHLALVSDALREGLHVPADVCAEYRALFDSSKFEREAAP